MANEVTSSVASELILSQTIERILYDAAYSFGRVFPLVRYTSIEGIPTNTSELPKWPLVTAASLTEGVDLTNSGFNPTAVSITAAEVGLMITVTDFLANAEIIGGLEPYGVQLGRAVATKLDLDIAGDAASYSTSVGSSGVQLTETNWLDAIYSLEAGNADPSDGYAAFGHPWQLRGLRVDIATSSGAIWAASAGPSALVAQMGSFYGVPFIGTTNAASANAAVDRVGAMFPVGDRCGLVVVMKSQARIEAQRDASLRATELVASMVYGHGAANTAANGGVKIVTQHE